MKLSIGIVLFGLLFLANESYQYGEEQRQIPQRFQFTQSQYGQQLPSLAAPQESFEEDKLIERTEVIRDNSFNQAPQLQFPIRKSVQIEAPVLTERTLEEPVVLQQQGLTEQQYGQQLPRITQSQYGQQLPRISQPQYGQQLTEQQYGQQLPSLTVEKKVIERTELIRDNSFDQSFQRPISQLPSQSQYGQLITKTFRQVPTQQYGEQQPISFSMPEPIPQFEPRPFVEEKRESLDLIRDNSYGQSQQFPTRQVQVTVPMQSQQYGGSSQYGQNLQFPIRQVSQQYGGFNQLQNTENTDRDVERLEVIKGQFSPIRQSGGEERLEKTQVILQQPRFVKASSGYGSY